jgi:hypothetical protein
MHLRVHRAGIVSLWLVRLEYMDQGDTLCRPQVLSRFGLKWGQVTCVKRRPSRQSSAACLNLCLFKKYRIFAEHKHYFSLVLGLISLCM